MAASPNKEISPWKIFRKLLGDWGFLPPTTHIYNNSEKPIFLIPISCIRDNTDPLSQCLPKPELGDIIPAKGSITVTSSKYDSTEVNPNSEMRILFCPGSTNIATVKAFVQDMKLEEKKGDKLFRDYELFRKHGLYLTCKEGKVIEDKDAGQDEEKEKEQPEQTPKSLVTETQEKSELKILTEEVQELKKKVDALKAEMEILKKQNTGLN